MARKLFKLFFFKNQAWFNMKHCTVTHRKQKNPLPSFCYNSVHSCSVAYQANWKKVWNYFLYWVVPWGQLRVRNYTSGLNEGKQTIAELWHNKVVVFKQVKERNIIRSLRRWILFGYVILVHTQFSGNENTKSLIQFQIICSIPHYRII